MTKQEGLWRTLLTTPPFPAPNSQMGSKSSSFSSPTWAFWVRKASSLFLCCSSRSSSPNFFCKASRLALWGGGSGEEGWGADSRLSRAFKQSPTQQHLAAFTFETLVKHDCNVCQKAGNSHDRDTHSVDVSMVLKVACPSPMDVMFMFMFRLLGFLLRGISTTLQRRPAWILN